MKTLAACPCGAGTPRGTFQRPTATRASGSPSNDQPLEEVREREFREVTKLPGVEEGTPARQAALVRDVGLGRIGEASDLAAAARAAIVVYRVELPARPGIAYVDRRG